MLRLARKSECPLMRNSDAWKTVSATEKRVLVPLTVVSIAEKMVSGTSTIVEAAKTVVEATNTMVETTITMV